MKKVTSPSSYSKRRFSRKTSEGIISNIAEISPLNSLPIELLRIIFTYLEYRELGAFDNSMINHELRSHYLSATHGWGIDLTSRSRHQNCFTWAVNRGMIAKSLLIRTQMDRQLQELLDRSRNSLKVLIIHNPDLTDAEFQQLDCPNLLELTLDGATEVTDHGFQKFLSRSLHLQTLSISDVLSFSSAVIPIIITHCPNLLHLNVSNNEWFDNHEINQLAESSLKLQSINLCFNLISTSSRSVAQLIQKMPSLLDIQTSRRTPLDINLMIIREINLKCILDSNPRIQLIGLRSLSHRLRLDLFNLATEVSQMDRPLRHIVQLLSHEDNEVLCFESFDFLLTLVRLESCQHHCYHKLLCIIGNLWLKQGDSQKPVPSQYLPSLSNALRCYIISLK
jgi:hypothetical protein